MFNIDEGIHKSRSFQFILQTLLICSMNLMASMTYVSMDFILVSDWFALAGYIFWNLDHGMLSIEATKKAKSEEQA